MVCITLLLALQGHVSHRHEIRWKTFDLPMFIWYLCRMTAGRGIVHSELPIGKKSGRGLQLWINLPQKSKLVEPDYQELLAKDIPKVTLNGVTVTVIAGKAFGVESPVRTSYTPTFYFDFDMAPNTVLTQEVPVGWNAFIYTISGSGVFGASSSDAVSVDAAGSTSSSSGVKGGTPSGAHHTIVLSNKGVEDGVVVKAGEEGCRFVLIAGQPINETVVQYGMHTHTHTHIYVYSLNTSLVLTCRPLCDDHT
jgi:redox-sensitive bicupin YhaK (pirin superfamily)